MIVAPPVVRPGLTDMTDRPVTFVADHDGCGWYRAKLPARVIPADVRDRLDVVYSPDDRREIIGCANLSTRGNLFQRPAEAYLVDAIARIQALGARTIVELDDAVWDLDRRHNLAARYWTRDAGALLALAIKRADAVTVSTEPLARTVGRWNRHVAVIPNAIDPADFPGDEARPRDGLLRVGWLGTATHMADLRLALPALREVATLPGVRLVFAGFDPFHPTGDPYRSEVRGLPGGQAYEYIGWATDMRQHYRNVARLDVAIAPLVETAFNRAKSAVKWLEYGALGIPCVASRVRPYEDAIAHGVDGFLAKHSADFRRYLRVLVTGARVRAEIGQAARQTVHAQHTIARRADQWLR